MGITSENVAQRYGVTRLEQDQAAVSMTQLFNMLRVCQEKGKMSVFIKAKTSLCKHELKICCRN